MMKFLHNTSLWIRLFSISLIFWCISSAQAQGLSIGANSQFYLDTGMSFTTSSTVVEVSDTGEFIVAAGNAWGSDLEYVEGQVKANGSGTTKLPVGNDGTYAPVLAEHSSDISAAYVKNTPTGGSNGTGVDAVGDVEYWELAGSAVITLPWNENSGISDLVNNNGGVLNSITIVGLTNGTWDLVSAPQSNTVIGDLNNGSATSDTNQEVDLNAFSQFTFGIDTETVLGLDNLFLSTGISLVSNPVKLGESEIRFTSMQEMNDLKVDVYDLQGRLVRSFKGVETYNGLGRVSKGNLGRGLYFIKFEEEGMQGVKKVIIE